MSSCWKGEAGPSDEKAEAVVRLLRSIGEIGLRADLLRGARGRGDALPGSNTPAQSGHRPHRPSSQLRYRTAAVRTRRSIAAFGGVGMRTSWPFTRHRPDFSLPWRTLRSCVVSTIIQTVLPIRGLDRPADRWSGDAVLEGAVRRKRTSLVLAWLGSVRGGRAGATRRGRRCACP